MSDARRAKGAGKPAERATKNKASKGADTVAGDSFSESSAEWPLWEVFTRSRQGLEHKHCGSLHATDAKMALRMARDVYTRRNEGVSIWVVPSAAIVASAPEDSEIDFDPTNDKIYRHPTFYKLPKEVDHM